MVGSYITPLTFMLRTSQEYAQVRRYSSRSSATSTIGSDDTLVSPLSASNPRAESVVGSEPLILTGPNNKQWIDLDIISPKLLQELRRRNAFPSTEDSPKTISKGAAKIKAWARQGRRGLDVRLGRKLDGKPDEFTNFGLADDIVFASDQKLASDFDAPQLETISELPALLNTIHEMPGTSTPQELGTDEHVSQPGSSSRSSMSFCDTLPRYEARSTLELSSLNDVSSSCQPTPALRVVTAAEPSSSHSSLQSTPTDAVKPSLEAFEREHPSCARTPAGQSKRVFTDLESPTSDLKPSDNITGTQTIDGIASHNETSASPERVLTTPKISDGGPSIVEEADVADVECARRAEHANTNQAIGDSADDHCSTDTADSETLTRRRTIPPKLSTKASVEELWTVLLKAQAKLLGPEHPLVYQAKYEFSISRQHQHHDCGPEVLQALRRTGNNAQDTLGLHPLVSSFGANLELLERCMRSTVVEANRAASSANDSSLSSNPPPLSCKEKTPDEHEMRIDRKQREEHEPITESTTPVDDPMNTPSLTSPRHSPPALPQLDTLLPISQKDPTPPPEQANPWANAYQAPHQPQSPYAVLLALVVAALARNASNAFLWLQSTYGPEPQVEAGKVRVRWTCSCGSQVCQHLARETAPANTLKLYDDFVERRPGAGRELEAYLNRPRARQHSGGSPASPSSSQGSRAFSGSSSGTPFSQTSWTSYGYGSGSNQASPIDTKTSQRPGSQGNLPFYYAPEPPWLLTCANESRYTPKLAHLDMSSHKITSDRDLALALRNHYFRVNQKWYRTLKLRGLSTLEFVQFEVHQNRFADIRKCPDMPPLAAKDYAFEPGELVPPVGPTYLLHLFKHPEDYDGELITYLRVPKKSGRLSIGTGWGIHLVEGFLPARVWMLLSGLFALASLVFGVVWAWKKQDVQGAFGVAAWICGLAVLSVGWLQAGLG